ncbi:Glycosyltransferase family 92 protein like [Actinidia chinensis var. chinensis]|uniref:Glycosyltransferase family 92 protein n=1 Tax=Actinidia chinensis var. chinensis TaxID=1590841 RepID=A0A2R6RFA0_ACTCC|nr:Glycosyltransferase family 92 protein like [Actinidia chinensis var. chinensis]
MQPMGSEKNRKRKRIAKPLYHLYFSLSPHYLSVRSLALCLTFITFLYLLSNRISIVHSAFRPVLVVPSFPLLSSFSSNSIIRFYPNNILSSSQLKIEDRILFPDHVLLLVSNRGVNSDEFVCVYYENPLSSSTVTVNRDLLWADEYNDFQSIVRCPLPPANFSSLVNLEIRGKSVRYLSDYGEKLGSNRTVHSWEMVAYGAVLDGNTAVVFVKGLNLRPDRESDPTQFSCHFGLGNLEGGGRYVLTTKAITAAQEVVRCSLPRSVRMNPSRARGIRVTVGLTPHAHARANERLLVPSVAKIFDVKSEKQKKSEGKYELCACTMVWNQASALREWIMYHTWLGIERWFIYDNNSEDGIKEVIEELEQEGYNVSRHVWPWVKSQEAGFSHCALRARDECKWVGFMDVDEYFYFPFPNPRNQKSRELDFPVQNSLQTLIANFSTSSTIAEIRTACHSFGPSGLSSTPTQGVMVGYTCRLQSPERHKSIVRPDALDITLLNAVHHFHLRKGFEYLNLPQSTAVINHYKYQVWESFRAKFFRRVATYVADWQENQNEGSRDRAPGLGTEAVEPPNWRLQFCEVWDTGLRDFVLANLADSVTGLLPWERTSL